MSLEILRMYRGDDRTWAMTLTADGAPIDLTTATLAFSAAATPGGEAVIELTSADGEIVVTGALAGEITVTIAAADTSALEIPYVWSSSWYWPRSLPRRRANYLRLYWDVQVTDAGDRRTWPEDAGGRPRLGHLLIYADAAA